MNDIGLKGFRDCVFADIDLQVRLQAVEDRQEFVTIVVETAKQKGFDIVPDEVEEALRAGRRAWIERWI